MENKEKMNKTKAVMLHLQEFGSITSWEAIKEYGATRLSGIIYNLRYKYDMKIINKDEAFIDRYGTKSYFSRYILVKEKKDNEQ